MKIVKLLEDIYNMHGRDIGDYAWLNATAIDSYKYAVKGDFVVYVVNCEVRADHQLQFIWPADNDDSLFVGVPVSFEELEPFRQNFDDDDINRVVQFKNEFDIDAKIKNYITCPGE